MGLQVNKENAQCYDGIPWFEKYGKAKKIKKPKSKSKKRNSKNDSYYGRVQNYFNRLSLEYPILFLLAYTTLLLIVPFCIGYFIY
mmetsp:Transcript_19833/g.19459  ORF Transcript_19833/g.19459 Transcript_19833/m.19459 type:complete len:85 (-) Transcript_19833:124-378(-)